MYSRTLVLQVHHVQKKSGKLTLDFGHTFSDTDFQNFFTYKLPRKFSVQL